MNNKTSDKDVTIKEDIRVLKNIEKLRRIEFKHCVTDREIKAIQNILVELEQKDKRIQELEEELEKANKQLDLDYVDDNYIPKQKVKDKIEELKNEYDEILSEYGNLDTDIVINVPNKNVRKYIDELVIKILVLQELLKNVEYELYYNSKDGIMQVNEIGAFGDSTLVAMYRDRRNRGITLKEMLENIEEISNMTYKDFKEKILKR